MSFRHHTLSSLIVVDPAKAGREILAAYRKVGACLKSAASELGVSERALHRWVLALDLRDDLAAATRQAAREGRLNPHRRPSKKPGAQHA